MVVSPHGILVLEVKGGRISVDKGIWYTTNEDDEKNQLNESPLVQAESARDALQRLLEDKLSVPLLKKLMFGFAVMFPDVKIGEVGVELTREQVFDVIDWDRKNLGRWVQGLYQFWMERTRKSSPISEEELATVNKSLRNEFDRDISLLSRVGDAWSELITLTEQQFRAVDFILANRRVVIEGGAGTGKTLVARKAARTLDAMGYSVLFICRSPVLASMLANELKESNVRVVNFLQLKELIARGSAPEFDALVVDEAQDILESESFDILDGVINGGIQSGRWYFFMDPNKQSSLYAHTSAEVYELIRECAFVVPLTLNCRNTQQIALHTLMYTGGSIGDCPVVAGGLPVLWKGMDYDSREKLATLLDQQLVKWIDEESVLPGQITLISFVPYENSVVQLLNKRWKRRITVINENYGEVWQDTQLTFATVREFKGLENRYVFLIDLEHAPERENVINEFYVAMTRANTVLCMPLPLDRKPWFESLKNRNATAVREFLTSS